VLEAAPTLDAADICREGLCVLPVWDERTAAVLPEPSPREIEKMIRLQGHRQLKMVPYKQVRKRLRRRTGNADLLLQFEKGAFGPTPCQAPREFWTDLKAGYMLRISLAGGEALRLFDGSEKTSAIFRADLYSVAARRVIWQAQSACAGRGAGIARSEDLFMPGLAALAELLPVNPKVSYIKPEGESW
jgi:hypothetical protein